MAAFAWVWTDSAVGVTSPIAVGAAAVAGLCTPVVTQSGDSVGSFSRCPIAVTPSSFRVSCVRLGRTVSSISFSRKAASCFSRPTPQPDHDVHTAPIIGGAAYHRAVRGGCLGGLRGGAFSQRC